MVGTISTMPVTGIIDYNLPTYSADDDHSIRPNCVISTSDLNSVCKELQNAAYKKIRLWIFPLGIHLSAAAVGGGTFFSLKYGDVDESASASATPSLNRLPMTSSQIAIPTTVARIMVKPRNLVEDFWFYPSFINNLALLNNINPRGIAKIYAETGKALKIVTSIGDYGELTLYINKINN